MNISNKHLSQLYLHGLSYLLTKSPSKLKNHQAKKKLLFHLNNQDKQ